MPARVPRLGDGNPLTEGDADWTPLGAPASNLQGPNLHRLSPAVPPATQLSAERSFSCCVNITAPTASPSHLCRTNSMAQLTTIWGTCVRCFRAAFSHYHSGTREWSKPDLSGYPLGFDKDAGITQGRKVADYVFQNALQPVKESSHH